MQLLILDTSQIQPYVFGSNRLRENIGASYLVAQATGQWALEKMPAPHNVADAQALTLNNDQWIERDGLRAEVIYVGGGNVVALFADRAEAEKYVRAYSRYLLQRAPGLQVVFWHEPFVWDGTRPGLHQAVQDGFRHLAQKKQGRNYSAPLMGLGVTEMCRSTALPAVALSPKIKNDDSSVYPISAEIQAKLNAAYQQGRALSLADRRLQAYLPCPDGYEYPRDFDDLGRSEAEQSYIAVVHADGDGMGSRFRAVGQGLSNRAYIDAIRNFSIQVDAAARQALQNTVQTLVAKLTQRQGDTLVHQSTFGDRLTEVVLQAADEASSAYYLPFRPLVFGGDDVTFVCDGRLGLALALEYMGRFAVHAANLSTKQGGTTVTASAGVAVVKSHYPFARAYALAVDLARSAKSYKRQIKALGAGLDWHFARSGLSGDVQTIREREYTAPPGRLTLRPVIVGDNPAHAQRTWRVIESGVTAFQDVYPVTQRPAEPNWSVRRNKVKALREVLREGGTAVTQFRVKFNKGETLPVVGADAGMTNWPETGWQLGSCGYFDAIEMLDWYIPFHPQGEVQ